MTSARCALCRRCERRSRPEFQTLFNQIWEELDVNV